MRLLVALSIAGMALVATSCTSRTANPWINGSGGFGASSSNGVSVDSYFSQHGDRFVAAVNARKLGAEPAPAMMLILRLAQPDSPVGWNTTVPQKVGLGWAWTNPYGDRFVVSYTLLRDSGDETIELNSQAADLTAGRVVFVDMTQSPPTYWQVNADFSELLERPISDGSDATVRLQQAVAKLRETHPRAFDFWDRPIAASYRPRAGG